MCAICNYSNKKTRSTDWLWFQRWTAILNYTKAAYKYRIRFHMLTLKAVYDFPLLITNTSTFLTIFHDYKWKVTFGKIAFFAIYSMMAMNNFFFSVVRFLIIFTDWLCDSYVSLATFPTAMTFHLFELLQLPECMQEFPKIINWSKKLLECPWIVV